MEQPLRTFVALDLGEVVRNVIGEYTLPFKKKYPTGVRWVKSAHLHLTLKFIPETTLHQVTAIRESLTEISVQTQAFELEIDQLGVFPSWQQARTLWIGIKPSETLLTIHTKMDLLFSSFGILRDQKKFSPHLTIARISDYSDKMAAKTMITELQKQPMMQNLSCTIDKIIHFKSVLRPDGPVYTTLSEHALRTDVKV